MRQRFLNQKLGKRNTRRAQINKAKRALNKAQMSTRKASGKADSWAAVQCGGNTETAREPASLTSQGVS